MLISWIDTSWIDTLQLDLLLHDLGYQKFLFESSLTLIRITRVLRWAAPNPWSTSQTKKDVFSRNIPNHFLPLKSYEPLHFWVLMKWWVCFFPSFFCLIDHFPVLCWANPHSLPSMKPFWSVSICLKIAFFCSQNSCWDIGISQCLRGFLYQGGCPKGGIPG